eukprot:CAMPEP_0177311228 /NCGR_PEP_ID=MMETSP0368-20130122/10247_1 /TAXON_ID=447022 ORGANISM="Scrippsiella hangoei-like, Strain SHHI-4" /NCGR_SAMPLE_ID=MMETSP0368 /ASSEMBLY_ACC=CAM_ASM_000363 /LENGTH=54 /DNA_ID=CAMNT_0018770213 /DNA_START=100 /DNA_END=264 /DNA_ORIENTATION=+
MRASVVAGMTRKTPPKTRYECRPDRAQRPGKLQTNAILADDHETCDFGEGHWQK